MKIPSIVFLISLSFTAYSQQIGDHYKGRSILKVPDNAVKVTRDSTLVYLDGKFYTIREFEKLSNDVYKQENMYILSHPDSISKFLEKRVKHVVYFVKPKD